MSEPFLSEVRMFGYSWAPRGWAICSGQLLPINQNQALFSLLGTTYGGNGTTTFALPDLQGRTPYGMGRNTRIGEVDGVESVTLITTQIPSHTHLVAATTSPGTSKSFSGNVLATGFDSTTSTETNTYAPTGGLVPLDPRSVSTAGGAQAHSNTQPSLVVNFCIALQGIFPSRS